jgi:uncharacterized protein (DUF433 family)
VLDVEVIKVHGTSRLPHLTRYNRFKEMFKEFLMSAAAISYPHIVVDDKGVARVERTRYKILHLAGEHYHYGWSAEELLRQHLDLRPEEVYAALTYFYDHWDDVVAQLQTLAAAADSLTSSQGRTRAELLARKKDIPS